MQAEIPIRSPTELEQATAVPFVMIHGDAYRAVPVAQRRLWADKMKALRMTYEYHELRGVGHGALLAGGDRRARASQPTSASGTEGRKLYAGCCAT